MFCLEGLLPESHLKYWQTFVLSCQYSSSLVISKIDILKADLLKFGKRFECLYGKNAVTANMHLHCHLKERFIDCGPVDMHFSVSVFNGLIEFWAQCFYSLLSQMVSHPHSFSIGSFVLQFKL